MQPLDQVLRDVRAFLKHVADTVTPAPDRRSPGGSWWSRVDEGTLSLDGTELRQYRRCVGALFDTLPNKPMIGVRAVRTALQQAIFVAVDIRKKRSPNVDVRCDEAIHELRQYLTRSPQRFRVVLRVNGLADEELPATVGRVEFARFDDSQLAHFREAVAKHAIADDERQRLVEHVEEWDQSEELGGATIAAVEVDALAWDAAESRALREVRLTLDVINFFSDLVPYNDAHLSLPIDGQTVSTLVLQLRRDADGWGSFHESHRWEGGMGKLSIPKLREYDSRKSLGFAQVSDLLGRKRNKLQDRLIASVQWAGRATVDVRREEAFLLYMIALESFVMADGDHREMSYRLRVRVAHLLGTDLDKRRRLSAKLDKLYTVRSKIVHSGTYEVMDADLASMRTICKSCLVRACTDGELTRMSSTDHLRSWFDDRILQ